MITNGAIKLKAHITMRRAFASQLAQVARAPKGAPLLNWASSFLLRSGQQLICRARLAPLFGAGAKRAADGHLKLRLRFKLRAAVCRKWASLRAPPWPPFG